MTQEDLKDLLATNRAVIDQADAWLRDYRRAKTMTQPVPPAPEPADPYANKAVVAALGTVVTTGLRWAISGEFSLSDEGVVALAGAITTVAVYAVSNYRRILGLKR